MSGETGLELTLYLLAGLIAGTVAGVIAPRRRRHVAFWTTATFIFPPTLIVLLFLPNARTAPRPRPASEWDDDLDHL